MAEEEVSLCHLDADASLPAEVEFRVSGLGSGAPRVA